MMKGNEKCRSTRRCNRRYDVFCQEQFELLKKIVELIDACISHPFDGIGKPEALKGNLKGYWSRRITDEHRLIYEITDKDVIIISCRTHYN